MITEIDFNVKGEERKKLAYAIGELLGMPVKYTRTPKFDYLIGDCILDKNGVFHASGDLSESKLELILERFYKGERIQQLELPEDETVKADVLSVSVPRNMFTDDKLVNLQKLIEGKQTLFKHAFRVEQLEVAITENQVSFPWFVILGIVTGNWLEMLVFLLPFTVLRQYAGGIHLEKAGSCMVVSSILVLLCGQYLASGSAVMWQIRIIWLAAVGVIFVMAPVDASSKKLDEKEKKVYGMRARAILIIECAIAGVFSVTGYSLVVNGIMVAHIVLASGLIL